MGLRIIDRQKVRTAELSDSERLASLEQEADHWIHTRGVGDANAKTNLIANYKTARSRIKSAEDMQEMAKRIRIGIIMEPTTGNAPHQRVDIATLLELL
jgi:hypothetical protein